jgi:DNA polymerase-1
LKARDGYIFVYRDYSQIELRLAAYLSNDAYLLGALREGRNIHEELCIRVFGYRAPEIYTKSKSANFERIYGGSLKTRSEALGVSELALSRVETPWPGFEAWAASQRQTGRESGVARTLMGREMELRGFSSSDPYLRDKAGRESLNMPVQGLAADITKYAIVKVQPLMRQLGGRVAHQEHDSILCEVPIEQANNADQALNESMIEAIPKEIRDVIDIPSKSVIATHWG